MALQVSLVSNKYPRLFHPLDERIELAGALERIVDKVDGHRPIVLGEIVQGMEIALEDPRELISLKIQKA